MSRTEIKSPIAVCGGGIAGTAAAIAAAREGAEVLLLEKGGCLGGTMTSSLVGFFIDGYGKCGFAGEFLAAVMREKEENGALLPEAEKYLLERYCHEAGVRVLYDARILDVHADGRRVDSVRVHIPDGERILHPEIVIDATGNGEAAALAGASFDIGNAQGRTQPMSMIGLVSGLGEDAAPYIGFQNRAAFGAYLEGIGVTTSLGFPNLQAIGGGLYALSINHEYGVPFTDGEAMTRAMMHGRQELYETVLALRRSGGVFASLALVQTPDRIGIREGRRIHGDYTVTLDDVLAGRQHDDAVCRVNYWVDIHALTGEGNRSYTGDELASKPYDIPFRALIAKDFDNLLLAGRCISGDFYAHASYRVAGNMIAVGEAAGIMAARAVTAGKPIRAIPYRR